MNLKDVAQCLYQLQAKANEFGVEFMEILGNSYLKVLKENKSRLSLRDVIFIVENFYHLSVGEVYEVTQLVHDRLSATKVISYDYVREDFDLIGEYGLFTVNVNLSVPFSTVREWTSKLLRCINPYDDYLFEGGKRFWIRVVERMPEETWSMVPPHLLVVAKPNKVFLFDVDKDELLAKYRYVSHLIEDAYRGNNYFQRQ